MSLIQSLVAHSIYQETNRLLIETRSIFTARFYDGLLNSKKSKVTAYVMKRNGVQLNFYQVKIELLAHEKLPLTIDASKQFHDKSTS